jgi:hypothetical protein
MFWLAEQTDEVGRKAQETGEKASNRHWTVGTMGAKNRANLCC